MATVPKVTGPSFAPGGAATPSFEGGVPAGAFGEGLSRSLEGGAQSLQRGADVLAQHAITMQGIQNKTDSDNSYVNATQAMNSLYVDYTENQKGGNALPNLDSYTQKLQDARTDAGKDLNPMARRMYEADSRRLLASLVGEMSRHAASENRKYTIDSASAAMDAAQNLAVENAGNPTFLANAHETIRKQSDFLAAYQGLDSQSADNLYRARMSKVHSNVIEQLANDSPPEANAYFESHKNEMVGGDIKVIDNYIKRTMQPYVANQIGDAVAFGHEAGPALSAVKSDPQGFFTTLVGHDVTITSSVRSPEHNAAVGGVPTSEHLAANGVAYDIVPAAGMTTAQLATKLKGANLGAHQILNEGDHVHVGWSNDPGKNSGGMSIANANTPEALMSQRLGGLQRVDEIVKKYYGDDPAIKAAAETRYDSILGRRLGALNAQANASRDRLVSALIDDPSNAPTDLQSLFHSYPGAQNDYLLATPTQQKAIQGELRSNANPTLRNMSEGQRQTWAQLDGESKTNPGAFANRDLMNDPATASLPFAVLKPMIARQNDIKAGKQTDPMVNRALGWATPLLKGTDVENTADNANNYNGFAHALSENIHAYYDINKKEPDQEWVRKETQNLLLQQGSFLGGRNFAFEKPETSGLVPGVPNAFTQAIIGQAKAKGVSLDNAQILQLYNRKTASGGR